MSSFLVALLGEPRALILDRLDAPATCGEIARALNTVPAGATHHLRSLEAAGLVVRRPVGRQVIVERTERGSELLALYQATKTRGRPGGETAIGSAEKLDRPVGTGGS